MDEQVNVPLDLAFDAILFAYGNDIEMKVAQFTYSSNMPEHTREDLKHEAYELIYTGLPNYDPEKSSIRTYTMRRTEISCLRYRQKYFNLSLATDYQIEQEATKNQKDMDQLLDDMGIKGMARKIVEDRVNQYTLMEISERHDISIYRINVTLESVKETIQKLLE